MKVVLPSLFFAQCLVDFRKTGWWVQPNDKIWLILMVIIWLMMVNNNLVGGWATYPSEKWWSESQLGWWNSQYMDWHKIPWFQSTNQITIIFPLLLVYSLLTTIMDPNHQPVYLYYFDKKRSILAGRFCNLGGILKLAMFDYMRLLPRKQTWNPEKIRGSVVDFWRLSWF